MRFPRCLSVMLVCFGFFGVLKGQLDRPNIVWLVTEDNSKHFLEWYDSLGAPMPHIESLAARGITFDRAFSNAPVCSVARSTIISGCYAPRIGAQYHRKTKEVVLPEGLHMFPHYLRQQGYYVTNNAKEDYNISKGVNIWDESSPQATYKNRPEGVPFFHVQNFGITHEGQLHFTAQSMQNDLAEVDTSGIDVFPYHPGNDVFRYTYAKLLDHHQKADSLIGNFLDNLRSAGLFENTIIFYYGDHGGVLPRSKGYLYESGLHVPMIVYIPDRWAHLSPEPLGSRTNAFISFVDLAPTVLHLAGIEIPEQMDGTPFLGKGVSESDWDRRDLAFGYADRFDEKYEMVRSVRKGDYKYIRSFQPFYPDGLYNYYRYRMLAYQSWKDFYYKRKLTGQQARFFQTKPVELLFDLRADPHEVNNLSKDERYTEQLLELRDILYREMHIWPDLSFYPESYFVTHIAPKAAVYGETHRKEIQEMMDVADLALQPIADIRERLLDALQDTSNLVNYWALQVCSSFGTEAADFSEIVRDEILQKSDNLVRWRAAEFLCLLEDAQGMDVLLDCLGSASSLTEANMILNTFAALKDLGYRIPDREILSRIRPEWRSADKTLVDHRLDYLSQ